MAKKLITRGGVATWLVQASEWGGYVVGPDSRVGGGVAKKLVDASR